jgi:NitT/TauT family transport system substrate-binding protein
MPVLQTRRRFLTTLSLGGTAYLVKWKQAFAADGLLETSSVRLANSGICIAPQYVAEGLLRAEGFTDVRYIGAPAYRLGKITAGEIDFSLDYSTAFVSAIDAGKALTVLAGVHVGCQELFARNGIRTVADLKDKSVGVQALGSTPHVLVSIMAAQVGLDPGKDIHWVTDSSIKPIDLFVAGKIDAFMGFPPEPQYLRARRVGHSILNTAVDRPWSDYYCCMLVGNREFIRTKPVATKRVLRAVLKAADLCANDPERVARQIVDGGFTRRYDYAVEALRAIPYDRWREYDPEDTIRYYALRLYEVGFIKSSPQKIIAESTDWRFLDEVKRELKA